MPIPEAEYDRRHGLKVKARRFNSGSIQRVSYIAGEGADDEPEDQRAFDASLEEAAARLRTGVGAPVSLQMPWGVLTGSRSGRGSSTRAPVQAGDFTQTAALTVEDRIRPGLPRGVRLFSGLSMQPQRVVKVEDDGAVSWSEGEYFVTPLESTDWTTDELTLQVRTVGKMSGFSAQLAWHGPISSEQVITTVAIGACRAALADALFNGTGEDGQPTGLAVHSDIADESLGGVLTRSHCAKMEAKVGSRLLSKPDARPSFITSDAVREYARGVEGFAGAGPLWSDDDALISYPAFAFPQVPSNLGDGEDESALYFADWSQIAIALFGPGVDVVIDPYRLKKQGMIEVAVFLRCDVGVIRPEAVVRTLNVSTSAE
jgi:hypothetical protein